MKRILLLTLLSITFITTQINANDKEKTEAELVAEFLKMDNEIKQSKEKTALLKKKTADLKQLSKTVDKLGNTLGVNNK